MDAAEQERAAPAMHRKLTVVVDAVAQAAKWHRRQRNQPRVMDADGAEQAGEAAPAEAT